MSRGTTKPLSYYRGGEGKIESKEKCWVALARTSTVFWLGLSRFAVLTEVDLVPSARPALGNVEIFQSPKRDNLVQTAMAVLEKTALAAQELHYGKVSRRRGVAGSTNCAHSGKW